MTFKQKLVLDSKFDKVILTNMLYNDFHKGVKEVREFVFNSTGKPETKLKMFDFEDIAEQLLCVQNFECKGHPNYEI